MGSYIRRMMSLPVGRKMKKYIKRLLALGRCAQRIRPYAKGRFLPVCARYEEPEFSAVNIDINNTCNQRCRFCFNSFEEKHVYMTEETFRRILPVFPLTKPYGKGGTGVYLSCLYEPSLSPKFLDFLEMLPQESKSQAFFTTNFSRPWKEADIERMLRANVHHINISVETLRPDRFEEITGSKHFESFRHNLEMLASLYPSLKEGYRPQLRYITMILRKNRDEVAEIVRYCAKNLYSSQHELRTPYISVYENMDWNREQLMEPEECEAVKRELSALGLPIVTDIHSVRDLVVEPPAQTQPEPEESVNSKVEKRHTAFDWEKAEQELALCTHQEYFFIRFHPSGMASLNVTKEKFSVLDGEEGDFLYRSILQKLCRRRGQAFLGPVPDMKNVRPVRMHVGVERAAVTPEYLELGGWCSAKREVFKDRALLIEARGKETHDFFLVQYTMEEGENPQKSLCRFMVCIDRSLLRGSWLKLSFLLVNRETLCAEYEYHYPHGVVFD